MVSQHPALPKTPRELLDHYSLAGLWPVPLEALAAKLGYACFEFSAKADPRWSNVSGFVDHTSKKIYINKDEALVRQRFTLAHEIGHVVLHGGHAPVDFRQTMLSGVSDPKEIEANRFASDLLMDKVLFVHKFLELRQDVPAIARYFGVSEDAARVRVQTLRLNRV